MTDLSFTLCAGAFCVALPLLIFARIQRLPILFLLGCVIATLGLVWGSAGLW